MHQRHIKADEITQNDSPTKRSPFRLSVGEHGGWRVWLSLWPCRCAGQIAHCVRGGCGESLIRPGTLRGIDGASEISTQGNHTAQWAYAMMISDKWCGPHVAGTHTDMDSYGARWLDLSLPRESDAKERWAETQASFSIVNQTKRYMEIPKGESRVCRWKVPRRGRWLEAVGRRETCGCLVDGAFSIRDGEGLRKCKRRPSTEKACKVRRPTHCIGLQCPVIQCISNR